MDLDIWNSLSGPRSMTGINGLFWHPTAAAPFRYRFTASLMGDCYFSYDRDTGDHYQELWWELFDHDLGRPLGQRYVIGETPLITLEFEDVIAPEIVSYPEHTDLALTDEPGLVIQGGRSLRATVTSASEWPPLMRVELPGGYTPLGKYIMSFRYRVLSTALPQSLFQLRILHPQGGEGDAVNAVRIVQGAEGLFRASFNVFDQEGYQVILRTNSAADVIIDSLTIVEGNGGLWARDYQGGVVVCNASLEDQTIPYNPDWVLVDGDDQHADHAEWLAGQDLLLPYEDGVVFAWSGTGADNPVPAAPALTLDAPWPNPGNPAFSIRLASPDDRRVTLTLHDIRGRRLARLWTGRAPAEGRQLDFRAGQAPLPDLVSGVYLLRVSDGATSAQRKWVLLR
jgi:hypothetical protein